jgi:hypothetical protein
MLKLQKKINLTMGDIKKMRRRVYDMKWGVRFGGDYVIHATKKEEDEK